MSDTPTSIQSITQAWDYEHFLCLILLHAAHADYDYSMEERLLILSRVSKSVLSTVERTYEEMTDFEQLNTILELKPKFIKDREDKERILGYLEEGFRSDGEYSRLEAGLFDFLERLL